MTGITGGAIFSIVCIILCMACVTIDRCAFVYAILVAILAGNIGMFAFQFESGQVVIELGRFPAGGGMAGGAIGAKATLVRVIFGVAGKTINGSSLHVRDGACREVALGAICIHMFSGQWEGEGVVVEIIPVRIHPIVTGQAILPKSQGVGNSESGIELAMAGFTDGLIERGVMVVAVAVAALE